VIGTNESFREIALNRGVPSDRVIVVRQKDGSVKGLLNQFERLMDFFHPEQIPCETIGIG